MAIRNTVLNDLLSNSDKVKGNKPGQYRLDEASIEYANERKQFDVPISSFQLTQDKLVWMLSEITKAQLLALELTNKKSIGKMRYQQVSMLKRNNVFIAR